MSTAIILYLLNTVIRGAAAALIIVMLEAILRRKLAFPGCRIIYGVLLLAVLFPFEYLGNFSGAPDRREEKSWRYIQVEQTAMDLNFDLSFNMFGEGRPAAAAVQAARPEAPAAGQPRNWPVLILIGCCMVAAFLSAKQVGRYYIWRGRIRKCVAITSGRVFEAFRESKRLAGMEALPVTLLDGGDLLPTAACYGTRSGGAVLCPLAECEKYSCQQLKMILIHELGHLRRHDNPAAFFLILLGNIFFMNPFLKIIISRWLLIAELDCDERVGRLLHLDRAGLCGYAGLLLDFQQRTAPLAGGGAQLSASAKNLKLRIKELAMKRTRLELAGIFAGIVGAFCFSTWMIMPELSAAEANADAEKELPAQFDAAVLMELPSNRIFTVYVNGTLIDQEGLDLLDRLGKLNTPRRRGSRWRPW